MPLPTLRAMTEHDYPAVLAMMQATPGVTVREADSPEATTRYLRRNPGLSQVIEVSGQIVACLMAGHDGRRGYMQHLIVQAPFQRQGLASQLVARCLAELAREGIAKSHVDVLISNAAGAAFWAALGWQRRDDIHRYSMVIGNNSNA